jgi:hypothetical protein
MPRRKEAAPLKGAALDKYLIESGRDFQLFCGYFIVLSAFGTIGIGFSE